MSITHAKVSGVADGSDDSLVQPSDWNADHTIELADGDIPTTHSGSSHAATITSAVAQVSTYVQADDPGAVGAGRFWLTTDGNLSIRNSDDDGWVDIVSTG